MTYAVKSTSLLQHPWALCKDQQLSLHFTNPLVHQCGDLRQLVLVLSNRISSKYCNTSDYVLSLSNLQPLFAISIALQLRG